MNNDERADIHNGIAWAIIIALASIIMGIVAVAHKCPRYNLDFDYLGLLVGILSLLVTALLGWNIYQVIDLKKGKARDCRHTQYHKDIHRQIAYQFVFNSSWGV